jgi:hypothetical protein
VRLLRTPNLLIALVLGLAITASFGPHLLMLGYRIAGARPPGALLYLCVLHSSESSASPKLVLHAPALAGRR